MYYKDPVEVLKEQRSSYLEVEIMSPLPRDSEIYHPMNAPVRKVCRRVQDLIERSLNASVSCRNLRIDGKKSVVGELQIYSEKLQILLTEGSLGF